MIPSHRRSIDAAKLATVCMHAQSQEQCCPSAILRPQGTYLRELLLLLQAQRGKFDHDLNQVCYPRKTLSKLCISGVRLQENASCEEHESIATCAAHLESAKEACTPAWQWCHCLC